MANTPDYEETLQILRKAANKSDLITNKYHDVLVYDEESDIDLGDGEFTPSLSKRVKQFVTSSGIDAKVTSALDNSNTALSVANGIDGKAQQALNNSNTALNGVFPYDTNIEYAIGVVTIKDGRFKQWDGSSWVDFGQDDSALKSANNLSDLPSKTTARTNLDVYSKAETDDIAEHPEATETTKGIVKINNTLASTETDAALTAAQGKVLNDQAYGIGTTLTDVSRSRAVNTFYTNTSAKPRIVYVSWAGTTTGSGTWMNLFLGNLPSFYIGGGYSTGGCGAHFTVLPGQQYKITFQSGTLKQWYEAQ